MRFNMRSLFQFLAPLPLVLAVTSASSVLNAASIVLPPEAIKAKVQGRQAFEDFGGFEQHKGGPGPYR